MTPTDEQLLDAYKRGIADGEQERARIAAARDEAIAAAARHEDGARMREKLADERVREAVASRDILYESRQKERETIRRLRQQLDKSRDWDRSW